MDTLNISLVLAIALMGAIAIGYLYFSADIFVNILKRPLKLISWGMLFIDAGVVCVGLLAYGSAQGMDLVWNGVPLSLSFYLLYTVGFVMIVIGAGKFASKPRLSQA